MIILVHDLTQREYDIVVAASNPYDTSVQLAVKFGMSYVGFKTKLGRIGDKLGAEGRWQIVYQAHMQGIIDIAKLWPRVEE